MLYSIGKKTSPISQITQISPMVRGYLKWRRNKPKERKENKKWKKRWRKKGRKEKEKKIGEGDCCCGDGVERE